VLFLISSAYVTWQTDGVIARLVYVAYCLSAFSPRQTWDDGLRDLHRKVMEDSRSWLEARGFPRQLVHCYENGQNEHEAAQPAGCIEPCDETPTP
jgi:hypothetical protein